MEISKSLFAATLVSATLLTGAVAYAASSGVIDGRDDNVGNLQPTAQNPAVTVVVDPTSTRASTSTTRSSSTTGSTVSTTRRPDVTAATAGTAPTSTIDDHGGDRDDNSGSGSDDDNSGSGSGDDDRRHGRGSDDD